MGSLHLLSVEDEAFTPIEAHMSRNQKIIYTSVSAEREMERVAATGVDSPISDFPASANMNYKSLHQAYAKAPLAA